MPITLGCIADDFTGATDLANMLVKGGLKTIQLLGTPSKNDVVPSVDAVIIALKTRTIPVEDAIEQSLQAMNWLKTLEQNSFSSSTAPRSIQQMKVTSARLLMP